MNDKELIDCPACEGLGVLACEGDCYPDRIAEHTHLCGLCDGEGWFREEEEEWVPEALPPGHCTYCGAKAKKPGACCSGAFYDYADIAYERMGDR